MTTRRRAITSTFALAGISIAWPGFAQSDGVIVLVRNPKASWRCVRFPDRVYFAVDVNLNVRRSYPTIQRTPP